MAEESKSSLQKVLEEMLARAKVNQSPQAQVNAQMSAKDPNFAAGALVGQLLASYIGNRLKGHQDRRDEEEWEKMSQPSLGGGQDSLSAAPPSEAGLAAGRQALPVDQNALQQQFLGGLNNNSALAQAANNQLVNSPFENLSEEERRRLMFGR